MTPEEKEKSKPIINEVFSDNGEHSHWNLIDPVTVANLWSENPDEDKARGFPVSIIEEREKAYKIELSNYAYQIDSAKRERDKAESENQTLKEKEKELREVNLKFTDIIQSALSTVDIQREEIKSLKEKLEAAEKVVDLINDTRIISVAAKVENIQKLKSALEHYYKSLKG